MDAMMNPQAPQTQQASVGVTDEELKRRMLMNAMMNQQKQGAPATTQESAWGNALAQGLMGYMMGSQMPKTTTTTAGTQMSGMPNISNMA